MIKRLVHTRFEKNTAPLCFFVIPNAILLFLICFANRQNISINALYLAYGLVSLTLYLIIGAVVLKNDNREKRNRLYAQLPVSNFQVRLSSWYFIALCLCIPTLFWLLAMLYISDLAIANLMLYSLLFYFHAGVLIALIYIYTQQVTLLRIIEERKLKPLILITFFVLSLLGFFFVLGGDIFILASSSINWSLLIILFVIPCLGLVIIDLYLYQGADNYLD